MGVNDGISVYNMDMRKESDTGVVAEEKQQKAKC